ncbi:predicted protein [Plenodomus lingam JN3]|uniref:Predicted protein n=1 Tax=Leptosphaeria maculans (strain JN3 / isolate v23.1.3 / race Av1-4-5-6-7-8) TaxID=985895 RepID=E5A361_LEPMJ|nr:predicted protein [Plenodomus lingam JN3]CBX98074.1 predicted protein [Plenodomus lingam JN3]
MLTENAEASKMTKGNSCKLPQAVTFLIKASCAW